MLCVDATYRGGTEAISAPSNSAFQAWRGKQIADSAKHEVVPKTRREVMEPRSSHRSA